MFWHPMPFLTYDIFVELLHKVIKSEKALKARLSGVVYCI